MTGELGGRVYFITDEETIKIGWSGAPEVRLKGLQSSSPRRLRIITSFDGSPDDERVLHKRFAHLHVSGEWFRGDPDLLDFIEGIKKTEDRRKAVALVRPAKKFKQLTPAALAAIEAARIQ